MTLAENEIDLVRLVNFYCEQLHVGLLATLTMKGQHLTGANQEQVCMRALFGQFRTVERDKDFTIYGCAIPERLSNHVPARTINTGSPLWRTTVSVTLPSTQRRTPERPWVHIAIRLSGVSRP